MPAIPIGQCVRIRLAGGLAAAAVLIATAACTTATPGSSQSQSQSQSQRPSQEPVVTTADGAVRGKTVAATREFLGIPYAAPPVGALRWQPPQPPKPWSGIRAATSYAPHCPQPAGAFGRPSTSEDCLYPNVFTPAGAPAGAPGAAGQSTRNLPVMVWVHGGSLRTGESDDYNPAGLVRHGVIVVTLNYRIGALGFLASAALAGRPGGPSGDYGLMDQQAALRWVQRNIHSFGGNPGQVTLFGESAGGLSTLAQLVSPGARGLFQRAIVESGTYDLTQPSLAAAESAGQAFAAKAGCASGSAACLRRLPVSAILASEDPIGYTPDVDGAVLTQPIETALARGQFRRVLDLPDDHGGDLDRVPVGVVHLGGRALVVPDPDRHPPPAGERVDPVQPGLPDRAAVAAEQLDHASLAGHDWCQAADGQLVRYGKQAGEHDQARRAGIARAEGDAQDQQHDRGHQHHDAGDQDGHAGRRPCLALRDRPGGTFLACPYGNPHAHRHHLRLTSLIPSTYHTDISFYNARTDAVSGSSRCPERHPEGGGHGRTRNHGDQP
jgi:hypothetical protein